VTFLTPLEAEAIAAALRPRIEALREMREMQVQSLPEGDDSWADTEEALLVHCNALQKLRMLQ